MNRNVFITTTAATIVLALSLLTGCATHTPKSTSAILKVTPELAKEIHDTIVLNESKIRTLKAKTSIKVKSQLLRVPTKLSGILMFKWPDSMRLITNKLVFTIFDMTYAGNQVWFNVPSERKVYTGLYNDKTVVSGFGISFKPYDVITIFNFNELFKKNEFYFDVDQDSWVMHIIDSDSKENSLLANLYIDPNYNVRKYEMLDYNGNITTSILFDNHIDLDGCKVPQSVNIIWPKEKSSFQLLFKDFTVNKDLPDSVFQFSMPENSDMIPIGSFYY